MLLKLRTGNGSLGTSVPAVTRLTIQSGRKKKTKWTIWGNMREFLSDMHPDDQYVLERVESDWFWDKGSMKWRLGRRSSLLSHATPIGQATVVLR